MNSLTKNMSFPDFQQFIERVYGIPNDRNFSAEDMLTNIQRFTMRGIKGIRKKNASLAVNNLLISFSWFCSLMNQLHINIEEELWQRFPGTCSYCGNIPCKCSKIKSENKKGIKGSNQKPITITEYQTLLKDIYPPSKRTVEDAGIHLAEETGELSEAFLIFKNSHKNKHFEEIKIEAADFISCIFGVLNSLKIDLAEKLSKIFRINCHACHKSPCQCNFDFVMNFKF